MTKTLEIKACGKLNLFLDITGKRSDGYHLLQTVMQSVSVYDLLKFEISDGCGIKLKCNAEGFPLDNRNLIWKAIDAFFEYAKIPKDKKITVTVEKNIPSMAGMAGGSSDCAAALAAMNKLCGAGLSMEQLCEIGIKLGADVPFTLTGGTVLCEGIGEKLTALPHLPEIYFAVVKPEVGISTPEAYRIYDDAAEPVKKNYGDFEKALKSADASEISRNIFNALEIAADFEEIKAAKAQMLENGALSSMMTGSGSAVFGIFTNRSDAERCINKMNDYNFAEVLTPVCKGWEIIKK